MLSPRFVSTIAPSAALVSLVLIALPRPIHAQTAPSASTLTVNSGQAPANLTCTVGGMWKAEAPAPTGTVTFTDVTESQTLGTATLAGPAAYTLQPFGPPLPSGLTVSSPAQMATGDFNGDGMPDIAFAYEDPTTFEDMVAVMLGNGDGTFQAPSTVELGFGIAAPFTVVVADVNGDKKPDLIIAGDTGDLNAYVAVLLGNGNGTFQSPIGISLNTGNANVEAITAADLNGDGKADLAVVTEQMDNSSSSGIEDVVVLTLLGDGSGNFSQSASYFLSDKGLGGGITIVAADLRNNGKMDLLVTHFDEPSDYGAQFSILDVLLGNGDGSFKLSPWTYQWGPAAVAIGDFNQDGKPDIAAYIPSFTVLGNTTPTSVQIWLGKGDGTFQPGSSYSASVANFTVFTGDFHGDGHQDILLSDGSSQFDVYTGAGNGTFQPAGLFTIGNPSISGAVPGQFVSGGPESLAYVARNGGGVGLIVPTNAETATLPPYTFASEDPATRSLQCSYGGDSNYSPSPSPAVSYVVPGAAAEMTSPTPNSELPGPTVTFTWSSAPGATGYELWLGTAPGTNDLYNSGAIAGYSIQVSGLPLNGETVYARLTTNFASSSPYNDYVFTAATAAALISPAPNSVLPGPNVTFKWNAATGATGYMLLLGTKPVTSDLYDSGLITGLSATVTGLPTNGETIYARLYTDYVSGTSPGYVDYTFTAATESRATLTSPAPNSILTGSQVTFNWSAGTGASGYMLWLGTTAGAHDIRSTGTITATSVTFSGLPTNGEAVYAHLVTMFSSGSPQTADYTFIAATETQAALTSPAAGSVLTGAQVTFGWTAGTGATGYILRLGTTAGDLDIRTSGPVTGTEVTFTGLPTNGETIKARLYTLYPNNTVYTDYVFTAAPQSALISPAPGSTLAGTDLTFTWSAVAQATGYILRLGTTPGAYDVRTSGPVTGTSVAFSALPANGETIYASLCTLYPSSRVCAPYVYTAATQTTLISPAPNSTLMGPEVTFSWSPVTGATGYLLRLGTTVGGFDIRTSGPITGNQVTFSGLPVNGETIHARLFTIYQYGSAYTDYVLTAAP